MSQIAHDGLEKRIDGFYTETTVVVQHISEGDSCGFPYFLFCPLCFFFDAVQVGLGIFVTDLNAV